MYKHDQVQGIPIETRTSAASEIRAAWARSSAVVVPTSPELGQSEGNTSDDRYHHTQNRVQTMVNEIKCYSVPFHLWDCELGEKAGPSGHDRGGE